MCFMKAPKPAPAPTPPATRDGDSAEMRAREEESRMRARQSRGLQATVLTSGQGADDFEEAGGKATLLGQTRKPSSYSRAA